MKHSIIIPLFICAVLTLAGANVQAVKHYPPHDDRAVELNTIKSLIFKKGTMTTGRRTSAVPQLTCVGGGTCGTIYEPEVVHCANIGEDYATGDPTWKCTAELENGLRLGTTDVVCEGFRDRDDPWILRGSCGLEYTMQGTPVRTQTGNYVKPESTYKTHKAQSGYAKGETHHTYKSEPRHSTYTATSSKGSWMNWFAGLFLLWLFYRYIHSSGSNSVRYASSAGATPSSGGSGGGFFGGGGSGGGGNGRGWGDTFGGWRDHFNGMGGLGGNNQGGYRTAADCNTAGVGGVGTGGGGGFWSGLGAGAGLGYLFGRRNNTTQAPPRYTAEAPRYTTEHRPATGGWRNWFGRTEEYEERPQEARRTQYERTYTESPPPQQVNVGPATQTATGYGTTRRRG